MFNFKIVFILQFKILTKYVFIDIIKKFIIIILTNIKCIQNNNIFF